MISYKRTLITAIAAAGALAAGAAMAFGPHQDLDCLGCHDPHYAKGNKLFKVKNEFYPNPRTGKTIDGISALCLGCHNLTEYGGAGIRPIYLHMTHPVNVKPNTRIANVPEKIMRDGILQCVSCHDPHPSNPNWKYLRVDTKAGEKVGQFCGLCHSSKADKAYYGGDFAAGKTKIFSSFNEAVGPGSWEANDPNLVGNNPTPDYIHALGSYDNSIAPAYTTVPQESWIYDSAAQNVPADLKKAMDALRKKNAPAAAAPAAPKKTSQVEPQGDAAPKLSRVNEERSDVAKEEQLAALKLNQ